MEQDSGRNLPYGHPRSNQEGTVDRRRSGGNEETDEGQNGKRHPGRTSKKDGDLRHKGRRRDKTKHAEEMDRQSIPRSETTRKREKSERHKEDKDGEEARSTRMADKRTK